MCAFVLVDPVSCGGEHSRIWRALAPELAKIYPYMAIAFPKRRCEIGALVSAALRDGHTEIVAVGSGRLDEAINGFFNHEGSLSPDAVLAVLPVGGRGIDRLGKAMVRPIDIGRVCYLSRSGKPRTRYFATSAVIGQPLFTHRPIDLLARLLGYRNQAIRLKVDQSFDEVVAVRAVTINNSHLFGAGLYASNATPDDGTFDITIRTGLGANGLTRLRGGKITAAPVEQTRGHSVAIFLDGQSVGRLPATFEILTRALNVRC